MPIEDNRDSFVSALIDFERKSLVSSSYSISKSARADIYEDPNYFLEMKFDDEYNNDETEFYQGDDVYILICASHDYECYTTGDTVTKVGSNMIEEYTEDIVFAKQSEQTLAYPPSSTVKYSWIGRDPKVNPKFDGMKVTLGEMTTGVLRCEYDVSWDRWKAYYGRTGTVAVTAYIPNTEAISYLTIDYLSTSAAPTGEYEAWEIQVLDYCTDQPVAGVTVTFDGDVIGPTDENGIVFVGDKATGNYPLVMTKDGYIDSDSDRLHNDSVDIP